MTRVQEATPEPASVRQDGASRIGHLSATIAPEWVAWVIIGGAGLLRVWNASEWSLWEDEETTIYFSLHPEKSFARAFPLFFRALGSLFDVTGVSVPAARLLVAIIGTLTLLIAYRCARRTCGQPVALVALVLMALSPGHLFWSQSIRYYGLVLAFELVSIWCFLEGLARNRRRWLLLSAAAFLLGLATHFSAALLAPVYAVFLLTLAGRRVMVRRYLIGVLAFGAILTAIVALAYDGFASVQRIVEGGDTRPLRFPFALLQNGVAYFGLPAVALAAWALLRTRPWSQEFLFFTLLMTIPPLELLLIRYQGLIFYVLWYYGFVALFGVVVLAAWGFVDLWRTAPRPFTIAVTGLALALYAVQLGFYFGPAHGDRPRWKEAAAHVAGAVGSLESSPGTAIFATVPGVVAHYMNVPPGETMGHPRVQFPPLTRHRRATDSWYIVESRLIEPEEQAWFQAHCDVSARFESRMIVRDRTLLVFRCGERP